MPDVASGYPTIDLFDAMSGIVFLQQLHGPRLVSKCLNIFMLGKNFALIVMHFSFSTPQFGGALTPLPGGRLWDGWNPCYEISILTNCPQTMVCCKAVPHHHLLTLLKLLLFTQYKQTRLASQRETPALPATLHHTPLDISSLSPHTPLHTRRRRPLGETNQGDRLPDHTAILPVLGSTLPASRTAPT